MEKNFDLDNLSGQEIKELISVNKIKPEELSCSALERLLDHETDLLIEDKGDMKLISRCSELLDEKQNLPLYSEEQINRILFETRKNNSVVIRQKPRKIITAKRMIVAAAVAASVALLSVVGSIAYNKGEPDYLKELTENTSDAYIDVGDITYMNPWVTQTYSTVEEAAANERKGLLWPTEIPEGVSIDRVEQSVSLSGREEKKPYMHIRVEMDKQYYHFGIQYDVSDEEENKADENVYIRNGIVYHIYKTGPQYSAFCYYGGNLYTISAVNSKDLYFIIDHIEILVPKE